MPNVKGPCKACGGRGQISESFRGDQTKQACPTCKGDGYVPDWWGGKKDCSHCDTRGSIEAQLERCRECRGKGWQLYWVKKADL